MGVMLWYNEITTGSAYLTLKMIPTQTAIGQYLQLVHHMYYVKSLCWLQKGSFITLGVISL